MVGRGEEVQLIPRHEEVVKYKVVRKVPHSNEIRFNTAAIGGKEALFVPQENKRVRVFAL